jgi:hypothetical protein
MLSSLAHPFPIGGAITQRCTSVSPSYVHTAGNKRKGPLCHETFRHMGVGWSVAREWWWWCIGDCVGPRPLSWF